MSLVEGALAWVLFTTPQAGGVGFVPESVDFVPLDYCEGLGGVAHAAFRVLYSKFEFAVQDTIKTPNLKPAQPETLSR